MDIILKMRPILFLTAAVAIFSAAYFMSSNQYVEKEELDISRDFIEFITTFNKQYIDQSEFAKRYNHFRNTIQTIRAHNEKGLKYRMGVNQFSDWSDDEWNNFLTLRSEAQIEIAPQLVTDSLADEEPIDWREVTKNGKKVNAIHPVRDQGSCGSCWAFSAIGAIESAEFIERDFEGRINTYSEQQLVDCDFTCYGCQGGLMKNAFTYYTKNFLVLDSNYPYKAARGTCQYSTAQKTNVKVDKQKPVGKTNDKMIEALADRPVAIAVQAGQPAFRNYAGGIMECQKDNVRLDHGILLIGWGVEGEDRYYIIKNSWGVRWGEDGGYARILMDGVSCGLL